jgi:outer membrane protein OmpU
MTNFKKIGLTALAASLVSVSAANAGSVTASASASINSEGFSGEQLDAGTTFSMANSVTLSGSGELDNGMTVSVSFELDDSSANGGSSPFDDHSVKVSSDSMGTLQFMGHGGKSAVGAVDTTAAGDMWDNFDDLVTGGTTIADAITTNTNGDDSFLYTSPSFAEGLNFTASYNPQKTNSTGSEIGYGVNYTGFEGLTLNYATMDIESGTDSTDGDVDVYKVSYAYGPVTATYSNLDYDVSATGTAKETVSYALSYTITDDLSVTYGAEEHERANSSNDIEIDGISIDYTTGGITISAATQSGENFNHSTSSNLDVDYWALGASFAF